MRCMSADLLLSESAKSWSSSGASGVLDRVFKIEVQMGCGGVDQLQRLGRIEP